MSIKLGLDHNVINDVLLEIQAAFRGCVDIQGKYGSFAEPSDRMSQSKKASTRKALFERVLNISIKSNRATTRLQWAIIKKDLFEQLVGRLIMFNDRMESLLDRNSLAELHGMQIQSNLMLLQVTDEVAQLRSLVEALNVTPHYIGQNTHKRLSDSINPYHANPESTVASLAQFKAEAAFAIEDISQQVPNCININHVLLQKEQWGTTRSLGKLAGQDVWLEWREQVEDGQCSLETQQIVDRRLKQLAALLSIKDKSPLFKAPFCLGYAYDDKDEDRRHALVYKVQVPRHSKYLGMYTLRDILGTHPAPSLEKRFALASALANSLFYLHAVSWLHKGIRSDNVLFTRFQSPETNHQADDSAAADISSPIISGFDYSRPDLIDEQSFHNTRTPSHYLYSHPDLLQFRTKRSRKCHDMYSLGLVLIEIALWRPIEAIVGIEVRQSRLLKVAQKVSKLNERGNVLRAELATWVGDRYVEVVRSCVVTEEGFGAAVGSREDDPEVAAEIQESFFENVVQKLRELGA